MPIAVGSKAPDFSLKSKNASGIVDIKLSDSLGKKNTVLLFFPLAFTGVCTQEMCDISGGLTAYAGLLAQNIAGKTVREVLGTLTAKYPDLGKQLFKSANEVNRFINLYVNDEDVRFLENLDTPLKSGDELSIVPAIAGG